MEDEPILLSVSNYKRWHIIITILSRRHLFQCKVNGNKTPTKRLQFSRQSSSIKLNLNTDFNVSHTAEYFLVEFICSVGIATLYGLGGPRIEYSWGDILHQSRPALGPIPPPIQRVPGHSRGVKRSRTGVYHPPPSSADVKYLVRNPY